MKFIKFYYYWLYILQLESYSSSRFWQYLNHSFWLLPSLKTRKKLIFTFRLKLTLLLVVFAFLFLSLFFCLLFPVGLIFLLIFLTPLPLIVANLLLSQFSGLITKYLSHQISNLITSHPKLTKIAVTGSFGKSSVKDFLYQIIDPHHYTLVSPKSYNTLGGIYRYLLAELTPKHQYLIAELAAYQKKDIAVLSDLIKPDYGILTAIGPQHLERFGNETNIIQTKFELYTYLPTHHLLVFYDNPYIKRYLTAHQLTANVTKLSFVDDTCDFYVSDMEFSAQGINLTLCQNAKSFSFTARHLFGTSMAQNLALSISQSLILGLTPDQIQASLNHLCSLPHRLSLSTLNQAVIIDNTFSSNFIGFHQILTDLHSLPGAKALITPGLVELGKQESVMHEQLGKQAASVFDAIYLIGKNARTAAFEIGLQSVNYTGKLAYLTSFTQNYWQTVNELSLSHQFVLLENDLTENYL